MEIIIPVYSDTIGGMETNLQGLSTNETRDVLRVDFHCHTYSSQDSLIRPEELVKVLRRKKLDRVVITDHNTLQGALEAHQIDPEHVIVGEEILTSKGEILAVFVKEVVPAKLTPLETIRILRSQGAFISISHPFDSLRNGSWQMVDLMEIIPLVDAIEGFNARCMMPDANSKAMQFANENHLPITAGSDAHATFELGATGLALHEFEDTDSLKHAINQGRIFGKKSPWWVHFFSMHARQVKRKAEKVDGME